MPPLCFRGCTKIEVYSVHLCILPNIEFIALFYDSSCGAVNKHLLIGHK